MKRYLFIGLLCLFNLYGMAEYYYYRGEKVTIDINVDSMIIYTPSMNRSDNAIPSFQETIVARDQVNQISTNDSISISAVGYIVGDTIIRKMSNCFYVKLYTDADTTLLKEVVEETQTLLLGQVPYMNKWYKIMVSHSIINNTLEMSNYFYETDLFADVDPGFVFEFTSNCVNDLYFQQQWEHSAINSCNAWSQTKGTSDIRVAIIDAGIDKEHAEFINTTFAYPSYDCRTNQTTNIIYKSHGTYVAGVIAANHNYGLLAGIAPDVCLMQVSHPLIASSSISAELASGISWAVQHNADVINCSWGDHGGESFAALHSTILEDAIEDALYNGRNGKGCIVVFASGNLGEENLPIDYPGYFTPENLVVGAIGHIPTYGRAFFSSYGSSLDVMAPGQNINLLDRFDEYAFAYGTSLAAPYVSGIAALILSINPNLTRETVTNIIESTAQKVGGYNYTTTEGRPNGTWHQEVGYGLVDAYAAVLAAKTASPHIIGNATLTSQETYTIANLPTTANVKWTYTFTPSSNSMDHMSGNAITFVNGDSTASVVVKRGTYQTVETTLPDPETGIVPLPRPVIKLFAGTVVLKATITYAQYSYVTTKTITLPDSDNVLPPINQIDGITDTTIEVTATADVVENNSIATYRLRHSNPISADNSVVHVEKLSDAGDDYIPYNGNYTLEVWHDQLGLVERIEDNTPYLYLDCGDMPTGVYQMILIVNEQIVAQSKLLKL